MLYEDENPHESAFNQLLQEAAELRPEDYAGALMLMRKCKQAGLTRSQTMMVLHKAEEATGLPSGVMRSILDQVQSEHPDHGELATPAQAAVALAGELETEL